ncbi:AMP-binding protein [Tateyamaria sp. ANG-S1]|uniref:AMP-binding protein n=1 Tax=Tateyamaria sp. ANG-S1 TaxID=1577905 RepID=UPI00057F33E1|nr:AMP-binding protein [Tateyamaria sp. ANG-S1]KIC47850.1 acyl-CoA synthetase [Tateyamaria sp. ANG-S1]
MFILNDRQVDIAPLSGQDFINPESHRYAIHLHDKDAVLSHILALWWADAGVFPIHPDIPATKARDMALQADCDRLVNEAGVHALPVVADALGGVLVQMSSGTTGAPKVITRTWDQVRRELESYVAAFPEPADMTPVIACPITHSYGLIAGVMVALERGHMPVVIDTLNPKYILRRMRELRAPLLYTSPAMLHTLAAFSPADHPMYGAMTSGTILSKPWFEQIRAKTTHLFQQYGCSEAGCIAINPDLQDAAAVGRPLTHLKLKTSKDPNAPAPIVVNDGQRNIDTGDLGYLTSDGMLVFVARQDDVIDVAGLNVYPQEVEQAALAMDGVGDALAFAQKDALGGDRVGLVFEGSDVAPNDLRLWLIERLAPYQLPATLHSVPRLPREANGKINRRDVARRFAEAETTL